MCTAKEIDLSCRIISKTGVVKAILCLCVAGYGMHLGRRRKEVEDLLGTWCRRSR